MATCTPALSSDYRQRFTKLSSTKISSIVMLMVACTTGHASEGEFVGLYGGATVSNSTDTTSNSFKVLFGSHITPQISLEFGYMNLGTAGYDDPEATNLDTSRNNISFTGAGHGSISHGQLGEPTVIDGPDTYDGKGDSTFTGISEFDTEGATISLSYSFPIIDNSLDFFVKAGVFAWVADYEIIEITAVQDDGVRKETVKESQTSAVSSITGAGLIYYPTQQLSFRAEVEATTISSGVMPNTRLQNISIGANWEF
jgi:hypothetical protein